MGMTAHIHFRVNHLTMLEYILCL